MHDYFFGLKLTLRPILIPGGELPPASHEALVESVRKARAAMEESKGAVQKALREYGEAEALYQRGLEALARGSQKATEIAAATQRELTPILATFEAHAQTRLVNALRLLHRPEVAGKIADAASLQTEADQLIEVFGRLARIFAPLQEVRRKTDALTTALQLTREPRRAAAAQSRIDELVPEFKKILAEIRPLLADVLYPFYHAREGINLAEFARTDIPATHPLEALYNDCACHVNRLLSLYWRVLGRLAYIAMQVEERI